MGNVNTGSGSQEKDPSKGDTAPPEQGEPGWCLIQPIRVYSPTAQSNAAARTSKSKDHNRKELSACSRGPLQKLSSVVLGGGALAEDVNSAQPAEKIIDDNETDYDEEDDWLAIEDFAEVINEADRTSPSTEGDNSGAQGGEMNQIATTISWTDYVKTAGNYINELAYDSAQLRLSLICHAKTQIQLFVAFLWHCLHDKFRMKPKEYYTKHTHLSCRGSTCGGVCIAVHGIQMGGGVVHFYMAKEYLPTPADLTSEQFFLHQQSGSFDAHVTTTFSTRPSQAGGSAAVGPSDRLNVQDGRGPRGENYRIEKTKSVSSAGDTYTTSAAEQTLKLGRNLSTGSGVSNLGVSRSATLVIFIQKYPRALLLRRKFAQRQEGCTSSSTAQLSMKNKDRTTIGATSGKCVEADESMQDDSSVVIEAEWREVSKKENVDEFSPQVLLEDNLSKLLGKVTETLKVKKGFTLRDEAEVAKEDAAELAKEQPKKLLEKNKNSSGSTKMNMNMNDTTKAPAELLTAAQFSGTASVTSSTAVTTAASTTTSTTAAASGISNSVGATTNLAVSSSCASSASVFESGKVVQLVGTEGIDCARIWFPSSAASHSSSRAFSLYNPRVEVSRIWCAVDWTCWGTIPNLREIHFYDSQGTQTHVYKHED
ncbi:unnamed protein product [Amoebophrya sp. A120]|nr:unnamed protein product [Amoebophrya sp. A120]|eukprot:GSA120T00018340001.1